MSPTSTRQPRRMKIVVPVIKTGQRWKLNDQVYVVVDDYDGEGETVALAPIKSNGQKAVYRIWPKRSLFTGKRGQYVLVEEAP